MENGVRKISQMLFEQFGKNNFSCDMDIVAQSDGTVRLLSLVPAFYYAMKEGRTVLIDELDHSIHPHLVRGLVRFFSRQKNQWTTDIHNPSNLFVEQRFYTNRRGMVG